VVESFAVLQTTHPPQRPIALVSADETSPAVKLPFSPLLYYTEHNALLGKLTAPAGSKVVVVTLSVQRGRRGSKPPEQLDILAPIPGEFRRWPRARQAGVLKAVGRAFADASNSTAASPLWWLALNLALAGYVPCARWRKQWQASLPAEPGLGPRIEHIGQFLVWREHLKLLSDKLIAVLTGSKCNPFLRVLTPSAVRQLLPLQSEGVATRIVEIVAQRYSLAVTPTDFGINLPLAGELAPALPSHVDEALAEEIIGLFETGSGLVRKALARRYPAKQHLLRQLFEAEMLVESPDGYIFSGRALRQHLDQLLAAGSDLACIGVGDIKRILKLPRRQAEALRTYLRSTFSDDAESCGPVGDAQ
jgi:hypothetical protein